MAPRKKRIPELKFSDYRNTGWHVNYRDPVTGTPRKQRFPEAATYEEALPLYHAWLSEHLDEAAQPSTRRGPGRPKRTHKRTPPVTESVPSNARAGSLLVVGSDLISYWEARARQAGESRRKGTIAQRTYQTRKKHVDDFLAFLNKRYGPGAVARMKLADLQMADVEAYNKSVAGDYSESDVSTRMQVVHKLIVRAGRKEHGHQVLGWNWESRDVEYGIPATPRTLPTLKQLKKVLLACGVREQALTWSAIGLGFGATDLAAMEPRCIDEQGYDLRRSKTRMERYGDTPPLVWKAIRRYLATNPRQPDQLMFATRNGLPLVHGRTDSVRLWWDKLRTHIGETKDTLDNFYVLRHLGATEYGCRDGCSVGAMKRWLGHGASSWVVDKYLRPVPPEHRRLINWVRQALLTGEADLKIRRGD